MVEENLTNMNPQTNREWFQYLDSKLSNMREEQADDRDDILKYMDKVDSWIKNHDATLQVNLMTLTRHNEKIDSLEKKVNTWSLTNTIVAVGAFISALFMKGS